jgi:hypothetical protein
MEQKNYKESYELKGRSMCEKVLNENPTYKVFWQSGYSFRGAKESEDDKQPKKQFVYQEARTRVLTFEERMQRRYDWAAAIDILVDHEKKEIHFNGFSCNDLY